jgi:Flp pilus assembly protein TadD
VGPSRGALLLLGCCGFAGHAGLAVAAPVQSQSERIGASTFATLAAEPLRGLRAAAAGLLLQAPDGGALPVAPLLVGLEAGAGNGLGSLDSGETGKTLTAFFLLEVDGDALGASASTEASGEAADVRRVERVEIYAYLLGSGGEVLGHRASAVSLAGAASTPALEEGVLRFAGLRISGSLRAEGAAVLPERLRLLVLDPASNRYGLTTLPIDLESATRWPPPSFDSEGSWWLVDLGTGITGTAGTNAGARSARPVLLAGRRHAFELSPSWSVTSARQDAAHPGPTRQVAGAPDAPPSRNLRATLRPVRANDRTPPRQTLLEVSTRPTSGLARSVEVEIPRDQPPGAYQLEVTFAPEQDLEHADQEQADEESAAVATLPIEVWIATPEMVAAGVVAWPALLRLDSAPTSRTDTAGVPVGKSDAQTARYLALLTRAESDEASSLEGLLQLLVSAPGRTDAPRDVVSAIARGAVRLVEGSDRTPAVSWQIIVPLLEHHRRAFLRGYADGGSTAALNSLDVAEMLALLFSPGGVEQEGRTLIADVLALSARDCEHRGMLQVASRLLLAAIEVDAGHRSSLEMLAFDRERSGDLEGAAETVQQLLRDDPRNRELRLRQAVLAQRRGRLRQADASARELVAERAGDWIEQLALEIRGSIALGREDASGDDSRAVELLRTATAEHPGNQRLRILYALALDRSNRQDEADRVLSRAETLEPSGPSPRYRYAQPAGSGITDSQRRLTAALPLLRAQLVEAATREVREVRNARTR